MSTSLADLAVNVSTNIASLETGMARAADVVNRAASQMSASFGAFNSTVEAVIGSVTKFAGLAGIGLGIGAFAGMIGSAIAGQAELAKLSERTGATVEALSAMRTAAKYAGVGMDEVASGMQRFAKSVVAAQDGTNKQAKALESLGFNSKTFATQFKTTDQAILAVAQQLNKYADGLGKTAIEQTLLGKSGANLAVFMREIAERGLDNVKVTEDQAKAAKALEDSLIKLKSSFTNLVNEGAKTLVPILQKIIDNMGTFKAIAIAAIAAFVVWPIVLSSVATAVTLYRDAAIGAALASEVLGIQTSKAALLLGGIKAPAELAAGGLAALRAAGLLLFAGFAGWEIGKFLSENFQQARLAGIAFVDGMLTAWENIKFAGQVAWESIKFAFAQAVESMKVSFGGFISLLGTGLGFVPGLSDTAAQVVAFGRQLESTAGSAIPAYKARLAELSSANEDAKKKIHAITDEMVDYELSIRKVAKATEKKPDSPVPTGAKQAITDLTKSIEQYQVALAAVQKAANDALAKGQLEAINLAQAGLKRAYDRGLIDFQQYWDDKTSLQRAALDVQERDLQDNIDVQQNLLESLNTSLDAIDPSKYKTTADYMKAVYEASTRLQTAYAGLIKLQSDLNVVQLRGTEIGRSYIEDLIQESDGHLKSIKALDSEIVKRREASDEIGMTASQIIALQAARVQEMLANTNLLNQTPELLKFYDDQIDRLGKLAEATSAGENRSRLVAGWQDLFRGAADAGSRFLTDFVQHGSSAFKNLWNDFKLWALEAIAKIAAQKIVVEIAGAIGLGGLATNALAGGSPLGNVLGGGAPGGGLGDIGKLFGNLFGDLPGFGTALQNIGTGFSTFTTLLQGGTGILDAVSLATSGLGSSFGALLGPIGLVAGLAIPLLGSLFKSSPSQVKGQFGVSAGTTGFEDNAFTSSKFGNLGFLDANTQQFSGEAAQAFNKIVSGALDAFAGRMSQEQQTRLADILQKTTFASASGTFTTEDFLQQYGGQVLQQVVQAAFDVLNPAFGSVVANFKGTADEIAKFGNTLLAINDVIAPFGDEFKNSIAGALADATQATADKVAAFVAVFALFGDAIDGLGPKLAALDPASMLAFVDALGGAAKMATSFAYLTQNFSVAGDRMKLAVDALNADFTRLGVSAIPQTHQQFLNLLDSFDLSTAAGRELYASVLDLSKAFVDVHGTADAAAQAVDQQAKANAQLVASATDFFSANFYSDAEKSAKAYAGNLKQISDAQTALGISIPTSVEAFRALIEGIDQTTEAGRALYGSLIGLAPAVFNLNQASAQAAAQVNSLAAAVNTYYQAGSNVAVDTRNATDQIVGNFIDQIRTAADMLQSADIGQKLAIQINAITDKVKQLTDKANKLYAANPYGSSYAADTLMLQVAAFQQASKPLVQELALFTTWKAQYGAAIADQLVEAQRWYTQQAAALAGNVAAMAILNQTLHDKQVAIITGLGTTVDGAVSQLQKLRDGIANYLQGLQVGNLSPLTPAQKLAQAQAAYQAELTKAQGGDQGALGDITKFADTLLALGRDFWASSQPFIDLFGTVTTDLAGLAGTTPTGMKPQISVDPFPAIAAALPANGGTLLSTEDMEKIGNKIVAAVNESTAALLDEHSSNTSTLKGELSQNKVELVDAINTGLK